MATRIEVDFEGQKVPAELLDFTAITEPWASYSLEDGTSVKIKPVLAKVFRVIDRYLPSGEPIYGLQIGNLPIFQYASSLIQSEGTSSDITASNS